MAKQLAYINLDDLTELGNLIRTWNNSTDKIPLNNLYNAVKTTLDNSIVNPTVASINTTSTSDSTTLTWSDIEAEPIGWAVIQTNQSRDWSSGLPFITGCNSNGQCTAMQTTSSYAYTMVARNVITSSYDNNTFSLTVSDTSTVGKFRGGRDLSITLFLLRGGI